MYFFAGTAVNPNDIKTLLVNDLSISFIKGKPVFSNGLKRSPKNPPDFTILDSWIFDNILADELFAKHLPGLENCALVNNYLCGKLG